MMLGQMVTRPQKEKSLLVLFVHSAYLSKRYLGMGQEKHFTLFDFDFNFKSVASCVAIQH